VVTRVCGEVNGGHQVYPGVGHWVTTQASGHQVYPVGGSGHQVYLEKWSPGLPIGK